MADQKPKEEMEHKKLGEWEKELGAMIYGEVDENNMLNRNQFELLKQDRGFMGVNHEERTKFLKDNGYELNRTNYMSSELTAKAKGEK